MSPAPHLPIAASWRAERVGAGTRVLLAAGPAVPLAHLAWSLPAGSRTDPARLEGLSSLLPQALGAGTARRDRRALDRALEERGADLFHRVERNDATFGIELLDGDWQAGLELTAEALFSPALPAAAVERLRRAQLERLSGAHDPPGRLADAEFLRRVGGDADRPAGGTPNSLERIGRCHLVAHHRDRYRPAEALLVAVGRLPAGALLERLAALVAPGAIAPPAAEPAAGPPLPAPPSPGEQQPEGPPVVPAGDGRPSVTAIEMPQAVQTELRLGHLSVAKTHPEFPRLQMLMRVLGRRLRATLRDRRGVTYSVTARLLPRRDAGPWVVAAAVAPAASGDAISAVLAAVEELRRRPIPSAELAATRKGMEVELLASFQSFPGLAERLRRLALNEYPMEYYETYLDLLGRTTAGDLMRLARHHLDPRRVTVVAAGPAAALGSWQPAGAAVAPATANSLGRSL